MKAIFGIFCRNTQQCLPELVEKMRVVLYRLESSDTELWTEKETCLVQAYPWAADKNTKIKRLPLALHDQFVFAACGRVDNISEISRLLAIPPNELPLLSDIEVLRRAYAKWGSESSAKIYGDWAYVAWHPDEHKLVLSRDHHGNTPLYYYLDQHVFAFASSRQALLALNLSPVELDELYLAQYLTSWFDYHGERTLHKPIKRLPPSHYITVTPDKCDLSQYWYLENAPELKLSRRDEYVAAFRELFDEAVNCRLRPSGKVAATLSGGLDSSSVAVTAAGFLKKSNQRLAAYISVPSYHKTEYQENRFENELPFARAVVDAAGNIDLHTVSSAGISPVSAIRKVLEQQLDPCHGAANLYWILDLQESVKAMGYDVMLTGAAGNGSISWSGDIFSQPVSYLLEHISWQKLISSLSTRIKLNIKRVLPIELVAEIRKKRVKDIELYRGSAIHPDFARRIRLLDLRLNDLGDMSSPHPREERCRIIMPGRSMGGAYAAELGAMHGLTICDPTADARLLALTISIPDHVYIDPKTGFNRWLIREAMKGRLPDKVRLNRARGRQAGDLVLRLRACAEEVESALSDLARGPSAEYVDVEYMRQVWEMIQLNDTSEAFVKSITILTRGIMAGLFVNRFYKQETEQ